MRILALLATAVLLTGCAPALSTLQPPTVVPFKHVHAAAGYGISAPVVGIVDTVGTAKRVVEKALDGEQLTQEDRDRIIKTTAGLALNPPSFGSEFQLGYGLLPNWEVDVRYAVSAWRLGARYQFLTPKAETTQMAGTAGLGVSRYTLSLGVPKYLKPIVDVDDFERIDVDLPVSWGVSTEIVHMWGGPKLIASFMNAGIDVCTRLDTTNGNCEERAQASMNARSFYVAGQAGIAVGYKYAWIAAEFTGAWVDTRMAGRVTDGTTSEFRRYHFTDFILYPVIGLIIRI